MNKRLGKKVYIEYRTLGDWHIFTSIDLPGLQVESKDYLTAVRNLAPSVGILREFNEKVLNIKPRAEDDMQGM